MQKSILITGCSSGIGLATALALRERGYHVFATARKPQDVAALRQQGLTSLILDIDSSESIKQALDEILIQTDGKLFAVFNNAGYVLPGAVEDLPREAVRAQFETNVFGPMELIRQILPIMRRQGYGRIIQNTSILGVVAMPMRGAYNASKFALEGFSHTLRQELSGSKIKVVIIAPGPIKTNIQTNAHQKFDQWLKGKESVHTATYSALAESLVIPKSNKVKMTLPPDAVVKAVIEGLESVSPRAHYYIGRPAVGLAFLRRILPDTWLDWIAKKAAGSEIK